MKKKNRVANFFSSKKYSQCVLCAPSRAEPIDQSQ